MNQTSIVVLVLAVFVALVVGGIGGFFAGVAFTNLGRGGLEDVLVFDDEEHADVEQSKHLERDGFQLDYPINWSIDEEDEDYDPDRLFSVDSPGSSYVMFAIGKLGDEPEELLAGQVLAFEGLLDRPTRKNFGQYGNASGAGAELKGSMMGIPTTIRLFSFVDGENAVMVTEQCPDEDLEMAKPGLEMIENSFELKPVE